MILRAFFILVISLPFSILAEEIPYLRCFELASERHQVPLPLLIGVARVESNFDADARSVAGAHGIMQVRWPVTAKHLGVRRVAELYNPCVNIDVGASYLRELLVRYNNDPQLTLAAYNYGPTRLRTSLDIPGSVQSYVDKVQAVQLVKPAATNNGDLVINSFRSHRLAARYLQAVQALVPDAPIHLDKESNDRYLVVLERNQLSHLDQLRLSRLFDLNEKDL